MNKHSLPGEGKLFLVPRTPISSAHHPEKVLRPAQYGLANKILLPLALIFLMVVGFAGYLCLYGNWERAKDFLCIFLPPITALMGAASTAPLRS